SAPLARSAMMLSSSTSSSAYSWVPVVCTLMAPRTLPPVASGTARRDWNSVSWVSGRYLKRGSDAALVDATACRDCAAQPVSPSPCRRRAPHPPPGAARGGALHPIHPRGIPEGEREHVPPRIPPPVARDQGERGEAVGGV